MNMKKDYIFLDRFIWDKEKVETNILKHSVSFELACRFFYDPALYEIYDEDNSSSKEYRYVSAILGMGSRYYRWL